MIEPNTARPMFLRPLRRRGKSWMPMPRPMPIIGPMSGEISMAPITTGVLSVFRPREATNIAKMSVSNCVPRNETPERMEASICGWSSSSLPGNITSRGKS